MLKPLLIMLDKMANEGEKAINMLYYRLHNSLSTLFLA